MGEQQVMAYAYRYGQCEGWMLSRVNPADWLKQNYPDHEILELVVKPNTARSSTGSEQESSIPKVAGSSPAVLTTTARIAALEGALREALLELETYEYERTGETYNNPAINALLPAALASTEAMKGK